MPWRTRWLRRGGVKSRSDFEFVEPLYDAILRGEHRKNAPLQPGAGVSPPLGFATSSYPEIDAVRQGGPLVRPQVRIGQQWYREENRGRANTLVPTAGPLISPETLAAHRRALDRVEFMADHPLGGAAYGIAAATGASPQARNAAMMVGSAIDTGMQGVAPLGATVRGPIAPPPQQPPLPTLRRSAIRHGDLNARGQATGVTATVTEPMLGTGTKAARDPLGWRAKSGLHRGHLLARELGGLGGTGEILLPSRTLSTIHK